MRRDAVLKVLESHSAELQRFGVKSLRLFGSVARDEAADGSETGIDLPGAEKSKPPHLSAWSAARTDTPRACAPRR